MYSLKEEMFVLSPFVPGKNRTIPTSIYSSKQNKFDTVNIIFKKKKKKKKISI